METLEQLKYVVKNAPEGASHIAKSVGQERYLKHNVRRDFVYYDGRTFCAFPSKSGFLKTCKSIRSLSDIKLIIELMEGKKKAYQAYVALEEIKQKYNVENKIAKALLKLAYECDEFALHGDLRKDIKKFLGDL